MKEVLDALVARWNQLGLNNTITGGISEGEVPERRVRPYASLVPLTQGPGCGGLKRTNFHEYLEATFEIRTVAPQTFEELDGTDLKVIDDTMRYAVLTIPPPLAFIKLFPGTWTYFWEDKYHKAIMPYSAWFSKPANYNRK